MITLSKHSPEVYIQLSFEIYNWKLDECFKDRQFIYIIVKVSKLDFYYRDLCLFNIVNQLMIRELHLTHLCHQISDFYNW